MGQLYTVHLFLYLILCLSPLLFRLSSAQRIVFIGHGAGCGPLTKLLEERSMFIAAYNAIALICSSGSAVMTHVKGVVQVVGHSRIPSIPKRSEELRSWYYKVRVSSEAEKGIN
jgi:histone deacetylase 6